MGTFIIVVAIVVGAATWQFVSQVSGEYLAMYIIEPMDLGASKRVPNTLRDGPTPPSDILEGKVSDVLLAAYVAAADDGAPASTMPVSTTIASTIVTNAALETPQPLAAEADIDTDQNPIDDFDDNAAVAPHEAISTPQRSGMVDAPNSGPELATLLALIGDKPHRQLDGTVFLPIAPQRVFGLRTVLGERVSVPVTHELPGRIVIDPGSSTLVQASNMGFVEAVGNRYPFIGQQVKRGDLLALMQPVNDHLEQARMLERIQELTNLIDMSRKRMARLEEVIYIRYRDSKIEALRVEIVGIQRQLNVLREAIDMRYELRAKTDGIISMVGAQVGEYVRQGQTIFEIIDPTRLWVEAMAFESNQAQRVLDASAFTADGRRLDLRFIGGGLKLRNQAMPLRFEIINPIPELAVDNPVSVVVRSQIGKVSGIKIPRSALLRGTDGRQIVWERRSAERFIGHHVSSQPIDADHVLITEGLPANIRVVVEGAVTLDQIR